MDGSSIFEADNVEVERLLELNRRRAKKLHDGEIEDCDFLWQGDGSGFKSVTALELCFSNWSSRTLLVLGLLASTPNINNEVQVWDLYEQALLGSISLGIGEKANMFAIFEVNDVFYIVVGGSFGREPELGRLRLMRFDERKQELSFLWCVSSDAQQRINHLFSSAIKVLKLSPVYPEDDGLPLQEDATNGSYCPRIAPQKAVDVPHSPWIIVSFKDKTFSIYTLTSDFDGLELVYYWSNLASPVSHTDLILAVTGYQTGTDVVLVTGSWDKTVRFWKFKWTKYLHKYAWKLTPAEENEQGEGSVKIFREHKKSVTAMASHVFAVPEMLEEEQTGLASYHISKVMVTGSLDKTLIVWDLESQQVIRKLHGHTNQVLCVQIYDTKMDGLPPLIISSAKDKQLIFWSLISGEKVRVIDLPYEMPFFSVSESDKGGLLVVGPCGSDTLVFNFDAVERIRRLQTRPVTAIDVFYPRPNETNPLLQRPLVVVGAIDATCTIFDYYKGEENTHMKIAKCQPGRKNNTSARSVIEHVRDHDANGHTDRINAAIVYTPCVPAKDGSCDVLVITASGDNWVKVWRIDGTFVKTLGKHTLTTYPLTLYNPEIYTQDTSFMSTVTTEHPAFLDTFLRTTLVISGGRDCCIKMWDLFGPGDGEVHSEIAKAHNGMLRALTVHYPRHDPCNPVLISGAYDNMVNLWNLRTREKIHTIAEHKGAIFALAVYNPYEHGLSDWRTRHSVLVTGCYDNTATTWELVLPTTSGPPHSSGNSSSNSSNTTADHNKNTAVLKVQRKHALIGHSESVTDLAMYTPRDTHRRPLIVTCSIDKLVMVWDLHSGVRLQTLVGHTDRVCFMTIFNPPNYNISANTSSSSHPLNFPTIISGGDDSMNIIWEDTLYEQRFMPPREMINRAFAFDLKEDDWPLITALATEWEGRIFFENSHLFHLAIRHKRPDFLLKFRRYLKRVLTFMREYDTCFWVDNEDGDSSAGISRAEQTLREESLESKDNNNLDKGKQVESSAKDGKNGIEESESDSEAFPVPSEPQARFQLLRQSADAGKSVSNKDELHTAASDDEKDMENDTLSVATDSTNTTALTRDVTTSNRRLSLRSSSRGSAEKTSYTTPMKHKPSDTVVDSRQNKTSTKSKYSVARDNNNLGTNTVTATETAPKRTRKTFLKSVREDLLDHIPQLMPTWGNSAATSTNNDPSATHHSSSDHHHKEMNNSATTNPDNVSNTASTTSSTSLTEEAAAKRKALFQRARSLRRTNSIKQSTSNTNLSGSVVNPLSASSKINEMAVLTSNSFAATAAARAAVARWRHKATRGISHSSSNNSNSSSSSSNSNSNEHFNKTKRSLSLDRLILKGLDSSSALLVHQTSLQRLESRHNKNLLLHAIDQNDLVSLRVILLCWAEILNADMQDILTQRLYHPIYFFPEADLRLLAFIYPVEFQHFIMALRLIRNEPSLLQQERACLNNTTRFEINGTHSRCCPAHSLWGEDIMTSSFAQNLHNHNRNHQANHSGHTVSTGSNTSTSAALSTSSSLSSTLQFIASMVLQIFENHYDSTRASTEQPITSLLVPLKMHADVRDLLDLFVYVAEQLNNVEIFDSDVGMMTLNYVWSHTSRSAHIVFSGLYLLFLSLHTLSVFLCESPVVMLDESVSTNGTTTSSSNRVMVDMEQENFAERGRIVFWLSMAGLLLFVMRQWFCVSCYFWHCLTTPRKPSSTAAQNSPPPDHNTAHNNSANDTANTSSNSTSSTAVSSRKTSKNKGDSFTQQVFLPLVHASIVGGIAVAVCWQWYLTSTLSSTTSPISSITDLSSVTLNNQLLSMNTMVTATLQLWQYMHPWYAALGEIASLAVNVSVILGFCIYGIEEFAQAFEKFNNLSLRSLLLHFVFDIWNWLDAMIILLGISGQMLFIFCGNTSAIARGFIAFTTVLMWCKLLYYLRPFSRSGPLVVMITTIVFDIRNLMIVLIFVLCGFAQAFWLISQNDHNAHFKDLDQAMYNAILYMLGQNIAPDQIESVFGKCLLVAFMLVMTLLLLNLLIALMGDTFSAVRDQGVARWRKEQACIILDNRFDASNFELATELPALLFPPAWRKDVERVLHWIGDFLPVPITSLLTRHQHPPYLHVLKYAAEVRSQPRIGYKKLRRLVYLSRSQVLPFKTFTLKRLKKNHASTNHSMVVGGSSNETAGEEDDDDEEEDSDEDKELDDQL